MTRLNVEALYRNLLWHRALTGKTWLDVAAECGTTPSAFTRIRHGGKPDADLLVALLVMLGDADSLGDLVVVE